MVTLAQLCLPFNVYNRICPYENLISMENLPQYIVGVTNPIFKDKKYRWHLFCDIVTV